MGAATVVDELITSFCYLLLAIVLLVNLLDKFVLKMLRNALLMHILEIHMSNCIFRAESFREK